VRRVEGIDNLQPHRHAPYRAARALAAACFDELHDQVIGPDVVERADVGMIQRRDRARLADESLAELSATTLIATRRPRRVSVAS
jgi:hypothetical protein